MSPRTAQVWRMSLLLIKQDPGHIAKTDPSLPSSSPSLCCGETVELVRRVLGILLRLLPNKHIHCKNLCIPFHPLLNPSTWVLIHVHLLNSQSKSECLGVLDVWEKWQFTNCHLREMAIYIISTPILGVLIMCSSALNMHTSLLPAKVMPCSVQWILKLFRDIALGSKEFWWTFY